MSLKDELKLRGFKMIKTRGKCRYYVKDGEKYAVAFPVYKGIEHVLIVEKKVFEELGYPSIFLEKKTESGMLVPCIQWGVKKRMRIHNLIIEVQDGMHVDHINHNRNVCIETNLRRCTAEQNKKNSARAVIIREVNGGYQYLLSEPAYNKDMGIELEKQGFDIILYKGTKCAVENIIFRDQVDCYLAYRDTARKLYKGNGSGKQVAGCSR